MTEWVLISEKFELDGEMQIAESDLSTYFCMQVEIHL